MHRSGDATGCGADRARPASWIAGKTGTDLFVRRGLLSSDDAEQMQTWQNGGGFSLNAEVRIDAADRKGLEWLFRYCARPIFASERLC